MLVKISYTRLEHLQEIVDELTRCSSEEERRAFLWWADASSYSSGYEYGSFRDSYSGAYRSKEEYAKEFCQNTGALVDMPDYLVPYIDFKRMAEDWEAFGDVEFFEDPEERSIHVFTPI